MTSIQTTETDQQLQAYMKEILLEFFNFSFENNGTDLVAPYLFKRTTQIWNKEKDHYTDVSKLACHKGCTYCCHLPIMCPPDLPFYIAKQLRNLYPTDKRDILLTSLEEAANQIIATPASERLDLRIRCPLLKQDNSCSIYEIRPFSCRAFTSQNAMKCAKLASTDDHKDITIEQDNFGFLLYQAATTVLAAVSQLKNRSSDQVYFFPALLNAINDPTIENLWHDGHILNEFGSLQV